jgi:hypothetical protein
MNFLNVVMLNKIGADDESVYMIMFFVSMFTLIIISLLIIVDRRMRIFQNNIMLILIFIQTGYFMSYIQYKSVCDINTRNWTNTLTFGWLTPEESLGVQIIIMNVVENFFSVADWIFSTMLSYDLIMIVRNPFVNNNKKRVKQGWIILSIYIVFFITFFLIHSHSMDLDKMKIKHYEFGNVAYW